MSYMKYIGQLLVLDIKLKFHKLHIMEIGEK